MPLLHQILKPERKTSVVDVGCAAIDGPRPYQRLLDHGFCTVTGFEPQEDLWPKPIRDGLESYHPEVIGDGSEGKLRIYKAPGMTSLFKPHAMALELFPGMREWFEFVREKMVQTTRLDNIELVNQIDFLKIDAQGSELAVIQGAARKLSHTVFAHLEVQFLPLYEDAPMFRDIDAAMHRRGFVLHTFPQAQNRMILPYVYLFAPYAAMHQVFSADVVYVRDFSRLDRLEPEQVKQMAMISHYCYGSFDLTYRCVDYLLGRNEAERYIKPLEGNCGQDNSAGEGDYIGAGPAPLLRH